MSKQNTDLNKEQQALETSFRQGTHYKYPQKNVNGHKKPPPCQLKDPVS